LVILGLFALRCDFALALFLFLLFLGNFFLTFFKRVICFGHMQSYFDVIFESRLTMIAGRGAALFHIYPAIHMQGNTGDVSRSRTRQKSHSGGNIRRLAEAFQRHVLDQFSALFLA
jgi:hypothetical protein